MSPEGVLKLTDFGASIAREDTLRFQGLTDDDSFGAVRWKVSDLALPKKYNYTIYFKKSPEMLLGETRACRADDVWSLGMVRPSRHQIFK